MFFPTSYGQTKSDPFQTHRGLELMYDYNLLDKDLQRFHGPRDFWIKKVSSGWTFIFIDFYSQKTK